MSLKEIFKTFDNIAKGPNSTIAGVIVSCLGGYMIYHTEGDIDYVSIEMGLFLLGLFLFLSGDSILGIHKKKDKEEDGESEE